MFKHFLTLIFTIFLALLSYQTIVSALTISAEVKDTSFFFAGYTSPNSFVVFREDNVVIGTTTSDINGYFSKPIYNVNSGIHSIDIWSSDVNNVESAIVNFNLLAIPKQEMSLVNIYLPATMLLKNSEISNGENVSIIGYCKPNTEVKLSITGPSPRIYTLISDINGMFRVEFPSEEMVNGDYQLFTELILSGIVDNSTIGSTLILKINNSSIPITKAPPNITTLPPTGEDDNGVEFPFNNMLSFIGSIPNNLAKLFTTSLNTNSLFCCCMILLLIPFIILMILYKRKRKDKDNNKDIDL